MIKVKINELCEITNGYAFKSDKYVSYDGARVIRITNVQKGEIIDNDPKLYPFSELKTLENYKISEGDILMSLTGNVGRVGKYPKDLLPAYINQRVCRVKSKSDRLLENYLFHFLNSNFFENDAIRNSAGAAQLNLSTKWVADYEIPLPTIETQQKIASILDTADTIRQKDKALLAKYDELTQALFLDMFGDPVSNPKGWKIVELESICSDIVDCPHSTPKYVDSVTEYPCIRTTELRNGGIDWKKMKYLDDEGYKERVKRLIPKSGDIIYGREGSYGEAAIVPEKVTLSLGQRVVLFRPKHELINSIYLHSIVRSKYVYRQAVRVNSGSTVGHVNVKDIRKFKILLPQLDIQSQFAERTVLIEQQKAQAQASLEKSEELFNSLLQKAFKGELVW